jgi:hypothetical protein
MTEKALGGKICKKRERKKKKEIKWKKCDYFLAVTCVGVTKLIV